MKWLSRSVLDVHPSGYTLSSAACDAFFTKSTLQRCTQHSGGAITSGYAPTANYLIMINSRPRQKITFEWVNNALRARHTLRKGNFLLSTAAAREGQTEVGGCERATDSTSSHSLPQIFVDIDSFLYFAHVPHSRGHIHVYTYIYIHYYLLSGSRTTQSSATSLRVFLLYMHTLTQRIRPYTPILSPIRLAFAICNDDDVSYYPLPAFKA